MSPPRRARVISAMSEVGVLREALTAMAIAATAAGIGAPVAAAHHGDTGEYDITRPLFVSGEVLEAQYGYPHAALRLSISPGEEVPGDLRRYEGLAEIDEAPALADLRVPEAGELEVILPPTITMDTADPSSGRPDVGEGLEGIFLARCPQNANTTGRSARSRCLSETTGSAFAPTAAIRLATARAAAARLPLQASTSKHPPGARHRPTMAGRPC